MRPGVSVGLLCGATSASSSMALGSGDAVGGSLAGSELSFCVLIVLPSVPEHGPRAVS